MKPKVVVVGAGLAGCEAAWQLAERGVEVVLLEMKPLQFSPAHLMPEFAELVCSNSLRSASLMNAVGLLKEEMRRLGSLILRVADRTQVAAGTALAVDRKQFSAEVTAAIKAHPCIEIRHEKVLCIPDAENIVLATGPLTSPELAEDLQKLLGVEYLYFYDSIAPIVYAESLDYDIVFRASRWSDGEGDYLNIPFTEKQYLDFVSKLCNAETVPLHAFEKPQYFEGCLPIEELARRGPQTLAFGPMKPVGLMDPRTGLRPAAVAQLRKENRRGEIYNLVGFQTKMTWSEQKRVLRTIPGMQNAVFARFGSIHRNTYVNAPTVLTPDLQLRARPGLYLAGQIAGVEGYVESAALGLMAGVNAAFHAHGQIAPEPAATTAHGALRAHLRDADPQNFQPMNVNYGLFPTLEGVRIKIKKREKNAQLAARALEDLEAYRQAIFAAC